MLNGNDKAKTKEQQVNKKKKKHGVINYRSHTDGNTGREKKRNE